MAKTDYPESSNGPRYRARCCGAELQSMHRYHVDRCVCGRCAIDGGADQPRLICVGGEAAEWLEPLKVAG